MSINSPSCLLRFLNKGHANFEILLHNAAEEHNIFDNETLINCLAEAVAKQKNSSPFLCISALKTLKKLMIHPVDLKYLSRVDEIAKQNNLFITSHEKLTSSSSPLRTIEPPSLEEYRQNLISNLESTRAPKIFLEGLLSCQNPDSNVDFSETLQCLTPKQRTSLLERTKSFIHERLTDQKCGQILRGILYNRNFQGTPEIIDLFADRIAGNSNLQAIARAIARQKMTPKTALSLAPVLYPNTPIATQDDLLQQWAEEFASDKEVFKQWIKGCSILSKQRQVLERTLSLVPNESEFYLRQYDMEILTRSITSKTRFHKLKKSLGDFLDRHPEAHGEIKSWCERNLEEKNLNKSLLIIYMHAIFSQETEEEALNVLVKFLSESHFAPREGVHITDYRHVTQNTLPLTINFLMKLYDNDSCQAFLPLPGEAKFSALIKKLVCRNELTPVELLEIVDRYHWHVTFEVVAETVGKEGDLVFLEGLLERGITFEDANIVEKFGWDRHWPEERKVKLITLLAIGKFPFEKLFETDIGFKILDPYLLEMIESHTKLDLSKQLSAAFNGKGSTLYYPEAYGEVGEAFAQCIEKLIPYLKLENPHHLETCVSHMTCMSNRPALTHFENHLNDFLIFKAYSDNFHTIKSQVSDRQTRLGCIRTLQDAIKEHFPHSFDRVLVLKTKQDRKKKADSSNQLKEWIVKIVTRDNPDHTQNLLAVAGGTLKTLSRLKFINPEILVKKALDKNACQNAEALYRFFSEDLQEFQAKLFDHLYETHNLYAALYLSKNGILSEPDQLLSDWADRIISAHQPVACSSSAAATSPHLSLKGVLTALYLRSDYDQLQALIKYVVEKDPSTEADLTEFLEEMTCWGSQVAKTRAFPLSEEVLKTYGVVQMDSESHQKSFGVDSFRQVLFMRQLQNEVGHLPLELLLTYFGFWRGDSIHQTKGSDGLDFYKWNLGGCCTPFYDRPTNHPSRYNIYQKNFIDTVRRHLASSDHSPRRDITIKKKNNGHSTVVIMAPILLTDCVTNAREALKYLEPIHQRICNLNAKNMEPQEFHREILSAYYDVMTANPLARGSAHIMLMVNAYWYGIHDFAPPQIPFELGFIDCQALTLHSKEAFIDKCMQSYGTQPLRPLTPTMIEKFAAGKTEENRLERAQKYGLYDARKGLGVERAENYHLNLVSPLRPMYPTGMRSRLSFLSN